MSLAYDSPAYYNSGGTYNAAQSTIGSNIADRVFLAAREDTVAFQAGIASAAWASTSVPRVFRGLGGYIGGRSRGRLPFIEFDVNGTGFVLDYRTGGPATSRVTIRIHLGGINRETVANKSEAILEAVLIKLRSLSTDNYMAWGAEEIGDLTPGPWGHQRDCTLTVEHTYDRSDYSLQ